MPLQFVQCLLGLYETKEKIAWSQGSLEAKPMNIETSTKSTIFFFFHNFYDQVLKDRGHDVFALSVCVSIFLFGYKKL